MSGKTINKNNDIMVKFVSASATILAGTLSAVKTMGFAYAGLMIAKKSNPIVGTISLVGLEIIYRKFSKTIITKGINKVKENRIETEEKDV